MNPSEPYTHHFADRLNQAIIQKQTPLVVGLDPRLNQLPTSLAPENADDLTQVAIAYSTFCCGIIDVVADLVPAVKPQAAFFEQIGPLGMAALAEVVDHATDKGLQVIMDAKRGDIGSTATAYASAFLGQKPHSSWGCDALTVNPYMGEDTLEPFIDAANKNGAGIFVLVKTSNPGSHTIQEKRADNQPIYSYVASHVEQLSSDNIGESGYGNAGAVVGATYPEQLSELRAAMPHTLFLIPGFGAQGGTAQGVAGGLDEQGLGGIINSSRAIIFAHEQPQYADLPSWQAAVEQATRDTIEKLADGTTASKLR
ncbi:orotidine-5'-phosphate decarboxylase [Mariniblastus sp.]|nr:orotidine-5'-phosphate decarboxylase [Mariniblastus sp.]